MSYPLVARVEAQSLERHCEERTRRSYPVGVSDTLLRLRLPMNRELHSFPGSAWERPARQAPPGGRRSLTSLRSQAEPGTEAWVKDCLRSWVADVSPAGRRLSKP